MRRTKFNYLVTFQVRCRNILPLQTCGTNLNPTGTRSIVKRDDVRYNRKQVTVALVLVFIHPVPVRDTSPRALQRNEREFGI